MAGMTDKERVGQTLRALRTAADLSQESLAGRMWERGHRWWQSTVAKAEAGHRAVSPREADDIAGITGADPRWAATA